MGVLADLELQAIPIRTSASDIKALAHSGCKARWFLEKAFERDMSATWFIRGSAAHEAIEEAILTDLSLKETIEAGMDYVTDGIAEYSDDPGRIDGARVMESPSNRNKSFVTTLHDEVEAILERWWTAVHPDSPDRHFMYEAYDWPPRIEMDMKEEGLYSGYIDATFTETEDQTLHPVDWKTGNSQGEDPIQLQFYYYLLNRKFGDERVPVDTDHLGWYHHLGAKGSKVQPIEYYWGHTLVEDWVRMTKTIKTALKEEVAFMPEPSWMCNYCIVRDICPAVGDGDWDEYKEAVRQAEWRGE